MQKRLLIFILISSLGLGFLYPHISKAVFQCCCDSDQGNGLDEAQCKTARCQWLDVKDCSKGSSNTNTNPPAAPSEKTDIPNVLVVEGGFQVLIGRVIRAIMGIAGSIALLMFVYGGFLWMTAAGNSDKIQKGKSIFIWATAGIAIIFVSYSLVYFVIQSLLGMG